MNSYILNNVAKRGATSFYKKVLQVRDGVKHESRRQSWLTSAIMSHDVPAKKILFPTLFLQAWGARWRQSWVTSAIMSHVGNHESRQSTALLYQFLRWNLSCNISWVRRNLLFKLGFLVPLRTDGFSCYNPTQTRVREITRRRVEWNK